MKLGWIPAFAGTTRMLAVAMLALACFAGCRRASEDSGERKLETIDVAPAISIATEDDPQEAERPPELVGILPSSFPEDLPIYLPASLIDFGTGDGGSRYVNLLTHHLPAEVERWLVEKARQRGWTVGGSGGDRVLLKGGVRVRLEIEDARPGTLYRYEY